MLAIGYTASVDVLLAGGALTEARDARGFTALMNAAWTGNVDAAVSLLAHGTDLDARESHEGRTALMWAAITGHTAFVELLLAAGGNWETTDNSGMTAEMLAGSHNQPAVVKVLCEVRAATAAMSGSDEVSCNPG
jgi:ankyrin repeat protein